MELLYKTNMLKRKKYTYIKLTILIIVLFLIFVFMYNKWYYYQHAPYQINFKKGASVNCDSAVLNWWGKPTKFKDCDDGKEYMLSNVDITSIQWKK